jgi:hypothetical protein
MDSTIIAAIIGGISAVIAAVLAAFIPHHFKNKKNNGAIAHIETIQQTKWIKLKTWMGKKEFEYSGCVTDGTDLYIGNSKQKIHVDSKTYKRLLAHFSGQTIEVGATMGSTSKPGTLDAWLKSEVTGTMISTYVASILKAELYAVNAEGKIKFNVNR